MTEERFNKFEERADAVTQSVELPAAMHRDYEARADQRMETRGLRRKDVERRRTPGPHRLNHEQWSEDRENGKH